MTLARLAQRRGAAEAVLVAATAVWGLAFLITRTGTAHVPVLPFLALRFTTAALVVRLGTGARLSRVTRLELRAGLALGLAMLAGYALQAEAMHTLAAGRTAFICALYVPLVPLIQLALSRRMPPARLWLGVALACAGLFLMTGAGRGPSLAPSVGPSLGPSVAPAALGRGEAFALAAAAAIAAEITLVGRFAARVDPRRLAIVECLVLVAGALALCLLGGVAWPAPAPGWIGFAIGLGCASAALQLATNWAMRAVPATRAILIYASEPVWAAAFGALAGETMGPVAMLGGALILVALVVGGRPGGG